MKGRTIIYAPNVHVGGGRILLEDLIRQWPSDKSINAFLDIRAREHFTLPNDSNVLWVNPTIKSRVMADKMLARTCQRNDVVICFHGLPPIFRCSGRVIFYMQNRVLIDGLSVLDYGLKTGLRLAVERFLCVLLRGRFDEYMVQSKSSQRNLLQWYGKWRLHPPDTPALSIMPFMDLSKLQKDKGAPTIKWDFVYVADGMAHKNHDRLLDAWVSLSKEGLFPSIALTLNSHETHLLDRIEKLRESGLRITNLGALNNEKVIDLYRESKALIFPSLRESFGMPLIEASQVGTAIIASELDYVYDVCKPTDTFDPLSKSSIQRAVKRFLQIEDSVTPIYSPQEFLERIFKKCGEPGR